MSLSVCLVAAVAQNGVIGHNGAMPWHLPTDLRRFRAITMGKPVLMGRKTFESIGSTLPGRLNVVLSRNKFDREGATHARSLDQAIKIASEWAQKNNTREICVIGGGEIYHLAMKTADRLHITYVMDKPQGNVNFFSFRKSDWRVISSEFVARGENDSADMIFVVYERNKTTGH